MRFFRVVLKVAGPTYIEADRYEKGETVLFYRGEIIFAQFPGGLVEDVSEVDCPPGMTSFFSAEESGG